MAAFVGTAPAPIPGPPPMPVIGWRGALAQFLHDPIAHMWWLYRNYGRIVSFVKGGPNWLLVVGSEFNQQLLSDTDSFYPFPDALPFRVPKGTALARLGDNLTSMHGEKHKQQRRLVMPAFHKQRIEAYHDDMVAIAGRLLDGWSARTASAGVRPRNISREMQQLTMRVAGKCLFGLDESPEASHYLGLIEKWMLLCASVPVSLLPFDRPGLPYRQLLRASEQLEAYYRSLIARKRAEGGADGADALSALLQAHDEDGVSLTDDELIGQTHILFVAGYETTAHALTWTLFLLCQHPQVLRALLDELHGTLRGEAPSLEQIHALPLLDRVIKESLRLLPPVYVTVRTNLAPFDLGPYRLPGGTTIMFSHYVTHHLPELFPCPQRFTPDRWLAENPAPYAYIPFSGGARLCIGAAFATMEMKIVLPMILQRFRLEVPPGARIDRSARGTLATKHGMPMLIWPQDGRLAKSHVVGNIHEMVELE
jgi:cytochrome P450